MKVIPNIIQQAKIYTKNWTEWDYYIPGVIDFNIVRSGRRSVLISSTNFSNIYRSRVNGYDIEKMGDKITIYKKNKKLIETCV